MALSRTLSLLSLLSDDEDCDSSDASVEIPQIPEEAHPVMPSSGKQYTLYSPPTHKARFMLEVVPGKISPFDNTDRPLHVVFPQPVTNRERLVPACQSPPGDIVLHSVRSVGETCPFKLRYLFRKDDESKWSEIPGGGSTASSFTASDQCDRGHFHAYAHRTRSSINTFKAVDEWEDDDIAPMVDIPIDTPLAEMANLAWTQWNMTKDMMVVDNGMLMIPDACYHTWAKMVDISIDHMPYGLPSQFAVKAQSRGREGEPGKWVGEFECEYSNLAEFGLFPRESDPKESVVLNGLMEIYLD